MAEDVPGFIALFVLLGLNAFFVGAEFAVISARRSQIEPRAEQGSRAAQTALYAMEHATLMLATSQLGITVCSLLILNVSEPAIHHLLEIPLGLTPLTADMITVVGFVLALVLVTFLHVVFGEMVPKNLSFSVPDRAVLILAPPLVGVSKVFRPIIWSLNTLANGVLRLFRVEPKDETTSTYTLEEVAGIVEQSTREGVLADTTGTIGKAFEFTRKSVHDVEVPIADIVALPRSATPDDIQRAVAEHGFSRYLLTADASSGNDSSGNDRADHALVGYVHLKDVLDLSGTDRADEAFPAERVRRLGSVPRDAELEDALADLRAAGAHLARSVDSDGTTTGVLFLEDVIEELVGQVEDAASR